MLLGAGGACSGVGVDLELCSAPKVYACGGRAQEGCGGHSQSSDLSGKWDLPRGEGGAGVDASPGQSHLTAL